MRVHQLVPSMAPGDATSNHILEIDKRLKQWGLESYLYAEHIRPEFKKRIRPFLEIRPYLNQTDDLFIYHYGIFHASIHLFRTAQGRRMLIYHNITPAAFFSEWDKLNAKNCQLGRSFLPYLKRAELGVGDSDFNRRELVEAGFEAEKTAVLPIFLPIGTWETLPFDEALQGSLHQTKQINWLSVGRIAPNKALEEIIRLFHVYKTQFNPQAHLYLVGSLNIHSYVQALRDLIAALDLTAHVTFAGRVSDSGLKTYYQNAHLFVSASYHEGFCVPLIESMFFELPILARNATAMPETLGQSGILFNELGYLEAAQTAHLMVSDAALRQRIIATQKQRLQAFLPEAVEAQLQAVLEKVQQS